jgi:hypothetical protein
LRLEPCWVPRAFLVPGRRLKLHTDDIYAFGGERGGIDERWFSSTIKASNGPLTRGDEGLSYVHLDDGKKFLLQDAVEIAGDALLGADVMAREGGWNILCKFFDNLGPIPHHMHYFPPQYNVVQNNFPYTFFELESGTTKDDIVRCPENWYKG